MPSIQHTNDPVTVTTEELQSVVKEFIEKTTGRKVIAPIEFVMDIDHPGGPVTVARTMLEAKG